MNNQDEPNLSYALRELADAPEPVGLADRALTGARGVRRRRTVLSAVAAVAVAGILVVPFALRSGGQAAPSGGFGAPPLSNLTTPATFAPCAQASSIAPDAKEVSQQNWPDYVSIAVGKLPPRSDYVMQSGYAAVCAPEEANAANAYAVINLGSNRQAGHLTLNLDIDSPTGQLELPANCAELAAQAAATVVHEPGVAQPQVLFCAEGTAGTPMTYGVAFYGHYTVTAAYADHRVVWMESNTDGGSGATPTISAEALRIVVTDPALVALIPVP